jgi:hypothetical protein
MILTCFFRTIFVSVFLDGERRLHVEKDICREKSDPDPFVIGADPDPFRFS